MPAEWLLERHFKTELTPKPFWLTEKLVFLGETERTNDFENREPVENIRTNEGFEPYYVLEDTALAYKEVGVGLTLLYE